MTWPLRVLAVFSIIGGVIGVEALFGGMLKPGAEHPHGLAAQLVYPFKHAPVAALSGLAAFGMGLFAAWTLYARAKGKYLPITEEETNEVDDNMIYPAGTGSIFRG